MDKHEKTYNKIMEGQSDANIAFNDLCGLLIRLGFIESIKGSHHKYTKQGIIEAINIQPLKDSKAKKYQVKEIRNIFSRYGVTYE